MNAYSAAFYWSISKQADAVISKFLRNSGGRGWLYDTVTGSTSQFRRLPSPAATAPSGLPADWILHGEEVSRPAEDDLRLVREVIGKRYVAKDIDEISRCFQVLAESFQWAAFPWGGEENCELLGVLTQDPNIMRKFRAADPERFHVKSLNLSFKPTVSAYDGVASPATAFRTLLLQEAAPGNILRNLVMEEDSLPMVAFVSPAAFEFFTDWSLQRPNWIDEDYEVISELPATSHMRCLYRPKSVDALVAIARQSFKAEGLYAFDGSTPVGRIRELFKTHFVGNDWRVLRQFSLDEEGIEWHYATKIGHQDLQYSLFSSRNAEARRQVLVRCCESDAKLISVF